MAKTIVALFDTPADAEAASRELKDIGVGDDAMDVHRHSGYGAGEGYGDIIHATDRSVRRSRTRPRLEMTLEQLHERAVNMMFGFFTDKGGMPTTFMALDEKENLHLLPAPDYPLDRDLFKIPVNEIAKTKVLLTVFAGEAVHGDFAAVSAPSAK